MLLDRDVETEKCQDRTFKKSFSKQKATWNFILAQIKNPNPQIPGHLKYLVILLFSVKEKSSEDVSSAGARGSQWHTPCLVPALTKHSQPTHFLSKLPLEKLDTMKTSVVP